MNLTTKIATNLNLSAKAIEQAIALLDEGNTVPFIARYRKEATGNMDDQSLRELELQLGKYRALEEKRADVLRLIEEQGKLTDELRKQILAALSTTELEDIYRPFRPKRRTRAMVAREAGLLPLAQSLKNPTESLAAAEKLASELLTEGFPTVEAAIGGASDILAEALSDSAQVREVVRKDLYRQASLVSKQKEEGDSVYRLYYDFSERWSRLKGYQVLAMNRGEKEGKLKVSLSEGESDPAGLLKRFFQVGPGKSSIIQAVCEDTWKRLLKPSLETELRSEKTEAAHEEAMRIFQANLRAMLLAPPLRGKRVLALDPGYRNGCKIAVTDAQGDVLATAQIYPLPPQSRTKEAASTIFSLIVTHQVEVLALGNGTATRETEAFVREMLDESKLTLPLLIVNEAGASVYSASAVGSAEFPEMDVSLRSAVSLARRLQDPLAELVKIEPESLGVGQYQHDMNQKELAARLGTVVEDCVNEVGCDINTASAPLLSHIAGINETLAKNVVSYRMEHKSFRSRTELKKVARLGPKAFEQCAGFLRIADGKEPLDNTSVHPESYEAARKLIAKTGISLGSPEWSSVKATPELAAELEIGLPTLQDILEALAKPGRDPREVRQLPERNQDIREITDLRSGMVLPGVVRNVTAFGAFVDIGVHQDGLVHISELSDQFVSNPSQHVTTGQEVKVLVLEVDVEKKRISLSMKPSKLN